MSLIVFRTEKFAPYLPDKFQINPNLLGYELAYWLSVELAKAGLITSYPKSKDLCWSLTHTIENRKCTICCSGSRNDEGNYEWQINIERSKIFFWGSRVDDDDVEPLNKNIIQCLTKEGIQSIYIETYSHLTT